MRSSPPSYAQLNEAIRHARAQHRPGHGSVLELLTQTLCEIADPSVWSPLLDTHCGVIVLWDTGMLEPDFSLWNTGLARKHRSLVVRGRSGELYAVAEDPWNEALLQSMARVIGQQPVAAATTRPLMEMWLEQASQPAPVPEQLVGCTTDGPIMRFVDQALSEGFRRGASDVHFECDR
ncbi:MAG: hypothetical protein ACRECQ_02835, partial [Burkholderiaceae bacterium]